MRHGVRIDPEIISYIKKRLTEQPRPKYIAIVRGVKEKFNQAVSERAIGRCLKEISLADNLYASSVKKQPDDHCQAPPDGIDVRTLESWGISSELSPKILFSWRNHHSNNEHDYCLIYSQLKEDLTIKKIPVKKALALVEYQELGLELNDKNALKCADIAKIYRPWESRDKSKITFEEIKNSDRQRWKDFFNSYECGWCGYVYNPGRGDFLNDIPNGTQFADLPFAWKCPACGRDKNQFKKAHTG